MDCITILTQMVRHNTVNRYQGGAEHGERLLAERLEAIAIGMGLRTDRLLVTSDDFNLLVSFEARPDAPWLMFDSHLDTVGVAGMTVDPFDALIVDGRMFGRGACDTKASGAAMLAALHQYALGGEHPNNAAVLLSIEEESRKTGVKAFVTEQLSGLGWRPVGVVVGEPTSMRPVTAHNGVARWRVITHGRAAHSSEPAKGVSAISAMVRVIDAIETQYIPAQTAAHPLTGKAQCSVNVIRGGSQINIVADRCDIEVDRRVVPSERVADVDQHFRTFVEECGASVEVLLLDPPLTPTGAEAFHHLLTRALVDTGHEAIPVGVGFGTNASTFAEAGLPAVVIGPGDIAQAHTADEWIELSQVKSAETLYRAIMSTPIGVPSNA